MKKILKRAGASARRIVREPSSWAGVAAIAQAMIPVFPQFAVQIAALSAVAGAVAMIKKESGANDSAEPAQDLGVVTGDFKNYGGS